MRLLNSCHHHHPLSNPTFGRENYAAVFVWGGSLQQQKGAKKKEEIETAAKLSTEQALSCLPRCFHRTSLRFPSGAKLFTCVQKFSFSARGGSYVLAV